MKKITVKQCAKLNITLDVVGVKEEYHLIESFVVPINLMDAVTLKKRKDDKITLKQKGIKLDIPSEKNNAFKAAELFTREYKTNGVDIILNKKIPASSGLGGSSADISAVIKGMQKLYNVKGAEKHLSRLGSDTVFTYYNKQAIISGKGEKIEFTDFNYSGYAIIITDESPIFSGECYKKFDELKLNPLPCTKKVVELLKTGQDATEFMKNDLEIPAIKIFPKIKENLTSLLNSGALKAQVAGSGSGVYGIFKNKKERERAYKKLKTKYGKNLLRVEF